jgi:CubicO group peptidase (beta-lactamase class C family)
MKTLIAFLFLLITFGGIAQQKNLQPDFSKARAIINDRIDNHQVPSISIAVVKDGKILWEESFGYADKENQQKATVNTPYYLASVSKTITATAIMKLAEQKLLNLDSPVNKYLGGGKVSSPMWNAKEATVSRVMSHTSGLTTFDFWCRGDSLTCAGMDDTIISRYAILVSPPGGGFDYSNLGYGILDRVISNSSGKSFSDYMESEIFRPLGMKNSYMPKNPPREDRAIRYSPVDLSRIESPYSHPYTAGASLIYSSAHDLALFAMLHLNDLKKKNKIISEHSIQAMQDTVARNGSQHYGLGWWINNDYYGYKGVLAQGGNFFSSAWLQLIPSEDIGVIILTNIGHGEPWRKIIDEVLSELLPKFKANMAAAQSVKQASPAVATGEPRSEKWKGSVRTYKGDVPVTFYFNGSKGSFADLGNLEHIQIPNVRTRPNWFAYTIEGDLNLEDIGAGPYNLSYYLNQKGDLLYGSVQTSGSAHPDTPRLSYWVTMKKVE